MKVAIFETEHFEGSYPVIKLFDDGNNDITIFTYEEAYEQFKHLFPGEPDRYEWKVKPGTRSKYLFILDMYRAIKKKKISLVYLNTISNNFIIYAVLVLFLRKTRVVLTIHNINSQFKFKRSIGPRRIIRYIGRRILISLVKEFNVVAMTMTNYLAGKLGKNKKVYCLPGAVFEETINKQTQPAISEHINIVIPGTVDGRRRDYEQAFKLIDELENAKLPVTVNFLGRFYDEYGKNILAKCKSHDLKSTSLKYYEFETVAQPEFDRVLNAAHFIFIPSVLTTIIEDGVTEIYGETMSSGNLFDVIKHAKPFIVPAQLKVDVFLEGSCYRYKDISDVTLFVSSMHKDPGTFKIIQQKALEASRNYTIEKVRERNAPLFLS